MLEEYTTNSEGLVDAKGTWTYKIPTIDTIPREFNVEILNSGHHKERVLSSKGMLEPHLSMPYIPVRMKALVMPWTRSTDSSFRMNGL